MAFSMLVCDIDGTLTSAPGLISAQTKQALSTLGRGGIRVTLATGRNQWEALPIVSELGIEQPVILCNGAQIYDFEKGALLYADSMERELVRGFIGRWKIEESPVRWLEGSRWHTGTGREFVLSPSKEGVQRFIVSDIQSSFPAICEGKEPHFWVFSDKETSYELTPKNAEKGDGLRRFCTLMNVNVSSVVALGNDLNDVSMLEEAGLGLVVANGHAEALRVADGIVCASNENPLVDVAAWMLGDVPWERMVKSA